MPAGVCFKCAVLVGLAVVAALQSQAAAHIGSPDVFLDGLAGPYRIFVTIRPPHAIPGVADVEVLTTGDDVHEIRIVPLPLTGVGAQLSPSPTSRRDLRTTRGSLPDIFG
jgi:hypothetical protein